MFTCMFKLLQIQYFFYLEKWMVFWNSKFILLQATVFAKSIFSNSFSQNFALIGITILQSYEKRLPTDIISLRSFK